MTDFTLMQHGTIAILEPVTAEAMIWADEHLPEDAMKWGDHGVVIEPRYLGDILDGIQQDSLTWG